MLLQEFERIAEAPNAMAHIRRFVLDLAVRGKLTDQLPTDQPANALVSALDVARTKLGAPRYEPVSSVDAPFKIPPSWEWVRLGEAFDYDAGEKLPPQRLKPDWWLLDLEDIESETGTLLSHVTVADRESLSTKSEFQPGDVLYGKLRPYLNKVVVANEPGYSTTEIVAIRSFIPLCPEYTCLALRRPDFLDYVTRLGRGTKMPRLRTPDALVAPFPLPPLAEQRRIVAMVEQLMALCDQIETAENEREIHRNELAEASSFNLTSPLAEDTEIDFFLRNMAQIYSGPEQLQLVRRAVLQLAFRGRLEPQDPDDEPAAVVLERIKAAGNGTVARRTRGTARDIWANEPYNLPDGWTWTRLPEVGTFGRGKSKHRPRNDPSLFEGGTYPFIQTGDVARSGGKITTFTNKYNDVGLAQSAMWPTGTLCVTIAANIADTGILTFDACFPDSVVGLVPAVEFPDARYFEYFLRTAQENLSAFAPSTAQKNINLGILNEVLIPMPPIREMQRIIARLDQLMALCDDLETGFTTVQLGRAALLASVMHSGLYEPASPLST
jgi:type I restriction enzyme S subunit